MKKRKFSKMAIVLTISLALNVFAFLSYQWQEYQRSVSSALMITMDTHRSLTKEKGKTINYLVEIMKKYGDQCPKMIEEVKEMYPGWFEDDPTSQAQE